MTSILPQIEAFQQVPFFHQRYAEAVLDLVIKKLLEMEEFEIGIFDQGKDSGSVIGFDADDFENVQVQLCFVDYKFLLVIWEHSEENFASEFKYKIFEDTPLFNQIPKKLREAMENAAFEGEPVIFKPQV